MSNTGQQSSNLTFSKEITSLLLSLNENPSSDNVKCLDEYIINYLTDISEKLYQLYNYKEDTVHESHSADAPSRKKPKRKIKIDDLKFIFRNDSEKLSRLTELSELAIQRDLLQKQISAPENFSMLGSYGDGMGDTNVNTKSKGSNKRKLVGSDDELDAGLFDEDEDDEIENHRNKIEENDKVKTKSNSPKKNKSKPKEKKNEAKKGKLIDRE